MNALKLNDYVNNELYNHPQLFTDMVPKAAVQLCASGAKGVL